MNLKPSFAGTRRAALTLLAATALGAPLAAHAQLQEVTYLLPAPGTLPLRGDLAHMALAGTHLAAHYVIPHVHTVGSAGAGLRLNPRGDAEVFAELAAGSRFELLDVAGDWVWGCPGPQGPSGWCRASDLAPQGA